MFRLMTAASAGVDQSSRQACTRAGWVMVRSASRSSFLFEHDLFGKPDSTFPDHAL